MVSGLWTLHSPVDRCDGMDKRVDFIFCLALDVFYNADLREFHKTWVVDHVRDPTAVIANRCRSLYASMRS